MIIVIRGLNLSTLRGWDEKVCADEAEAREIIDGHRKNRGHWKLDPVVYGIVRREAA